jgi:hypothetical protein
MKNYIRWQNSQDQKYNQKAQQIIKNWANKKTISKLEAIASSNTSFVDAVKEFHQSNKFQALDSKIKQLDVEIRNNFHKILCSEYFLTLQTLFIYPRADSTEPRMYLNLDNNNDPLITKTKPHDKPVPLDYFAARFDEGIRDWILENNKDLVRINNKIKKLIKFDDLKDYARILHFSLPVSYQLYDTPYELRQNNTRFSFYKA